MGVSWTLLNCLTKAPPTDKFAMGRERTFIMVKPDGVQRGFVGDIIKRMEMRGYKMVAMKMIHLRTLPRSTMLTFHLCHSSVVSADSSHLAHALPWSGKVPPLLQLPVT